MANVSELKKGNPEDMPGFGNSQFGLKAS